jgi:ribonuclease VapC
LIVDASVVVALLLGEATVPWIVETLDRHKAEPLSMPWPNIAEVALAIERVKAGVDLEKYLSGASIAPLENDFAIVALVATARERFPLNFGDCFAYAHAKRRNEALLTLDADFLKTDLAKVLHPDRA